MVRFMVKSLAAFLCVVALTACGGGAAEKGDNADQAKTWKDSFPDCAAVWKVGKKLPADYEHGCLADGDSRVDVAYTACADGTRLFVHRTGGKNTHIAITGSKIRRYSVETQLAEYDACLGS
jgi:hypothetical protein